MNKKPMPASSEYEIIPGRKQIGLIRLYRVSKEGKYCTMYAMVARDGSVAWYPSRVQGTELTLQRAQEVVKKLLGE